MSKLLLALTLLLPSCASSSALVHSPIPLGHVTIDTTGSLAEFAPTSTPAPKELVTTIGEFTGPSLAGSLKDIITAFEAGNKDQSVRITSPGGSIWLGLMFIQQIDDMRAQGLKLTCYSDIVTASMATVFMESSCDVRYSTPRTMFLFHNGSTEVDPGTVAQIENELQTLKAANEILAGVIAKRLGMSLDDYKAKVANNNWVLTPDQALAAHAIDGIVQVSDVPRAKLDTTSADE